MSDAHRSSNRASASVDAGAWMKRHRFLVYEERIAKARLDFFTHGAIPRLWARPRLSLFRRLKNFIMQIVKPKERT